jgi:hypothetical protein
MPSFDRLGAQRIILHVPADLFLLLRRERELDGRLAFDVGLRRALERETDGVFPINRRVLSDLEYVTAHGDTMIGTRRGSCQQFTG